jgi:hypothetical protein
MSQRLENIVLLICKRIWRVWLLSWSNVGYWARGQGLAMGINEHKILRYEVINNTGIPVALAGTFMT